MKNINPYRGSVRLPFLVFAIFSFLLCFQSLKAQDTEALVNDYLQTRVEQGSLTQADAVEWALTDQHINSLSCVHHIYFRQTHEGLAVYGTESSIHVNPDNTLLTSHNQFIFGLKDKIQDAFSPRIRPEDAIELVTRQLELNLTESLTLISSMQEDGEETYLFSGGGIAQDLIPVSLAYQQTEDGQVLLTWDLSINEVAGEHWWSIQVDATNGQILEKQDWVLSCNWEDSHHHTTHDANCSSPIAASSNTLAKYDHATMVGNYKVFAMPTESPGHGSRTVVSNPDNAIASPFGWHDDNGVAGAEYTNTRGNNVHAFHGGNLANYSPDGTNTHTFDFPFNPVWSAGNQSEDAAITNLFYWNNIIHDVLYGYGFNEASGNFQANNYGNGGLANDEVQAKAQIKNWGNATFATPPDGHQPTMSMYYNNGRDGAFDNLVIGHEYGHGLSIRLTGGASNTNCLRNAEQMGEGWSDWVGLMLTAETGDLGTDARTVGTWLFNQTPNGAGIRQYPYSTDMAVNPHTYDAIKSMSSPHPVGALWAAMLWEVTQALIDLYGFDADLYNGTGGNNIAMALVVHGLKLQPCSPGFVDGRDAILAADVALYGGAHECLIWEAFAKRGLGFSASQGSSSNTNDGTEAFDIPPTCQSDCDGYDLNETIVYSSDNTFKAENKINATATVSVGRIITYEAGLAIHLNDGFKANKAGTFYGRIEACDEGLVEEFLSLTTAEIKEAHTIKACAIPDEKEPKEQATARTAATNYKITNGQLVAKSYPNPFTEQTTIEFELPETESISLAVFDTKGQLVQQLIVNEIRAKGSHTVVFRPQNAVPGIYFYRLQTSKAILSGQMILIE